MEVLIFSRVRLAEPGVHALCTFHTAASLARLGPRVTLHADRQGASDDTIHRVMGVAPGSGLIIRQAEWQYRAGAAAWAARGWIRRSNDREPRWAFFNEVRRYVPILMRRARAAGWRVLFEAHNAAGRMAVEKAGGKGDPRAALRGALEREVLDLSDAVVAPQELTLRSITPLLGRGTPTAVIPNGTLLPPAPASGARDIDLLYMGSLQDWKGLETLLAAVALLPSCRLTLVGGRDGRRRDEMRRLARGLGCGDRVRFVPQVPPAEVWRWYARARVGVVPLHGGFLEAREYTCPVKLVEMMAAGVPIVAARLPSVQRIVREGEEALMAAWDDPEELARAIGRLLADRALADRLARRARRKAEGFSHERRAERLIGVMDEAADRAPAAATAVSRSRARRPALARAGLMAAALAAALAGGEMFLRVFMPQRLDPVVEWSDGTLRHQPSLRPYNSLGLRGSDVAPAKSPGVTRILFLGGALVEGRPVGEDDVVTAVLSRLERREGRRAEVINAGVAGAGTGDELLLWEKLGRSLDPDVVVLGFHPNDVRDNAERTGPRVAAGAGGPAGERSARWLYDARRDLAARSHLYAFVRAALRDLRERAERNGEPRRVAPLQTADLFEEDGPPEVARAWDLTETLLGRLKRGVEDSGAELMVVSLPMRMQIDEEFWRDYAGSEGLERRRYDLDLPARRLGAWARAEDARFLDLLPAMRSAAEGRDLYDGVEMAWNAEAHRVAAERIRLALF